MSAALDVALAMEFATVFVPRGRLLLWDRLHGYLLRFGRRTADTFCRLNPARRYHHNPQKNMSAKTPECWASDPQERGLCIEISAE